MIEHMVSQLRLEVFSFLFINLLIDQLIDDSEAASSWVAAVANLLVVMTGRQLKESMDISHRISVLRRENVYGTLRKEFISELPNLLAGLSFTSEALFGNAFSKSVKKQALRVRY